MNWEVIGAVSELVGAVAVIVSLVYIAREIRQNTDVERASTRHAIAETIMNAPLQIVASESLAAVMHRAFSAEELSPEDRLRVGAYCYATMRSWENIHYQYRAGMLSDDEWRAFELNLKFLLQAGPWKTFWAQEKAIFNTPFQELVDALLEQLKAEPRLMPDSLLFAGKPED